MALYVFMVGGLDAKRDDEKVDFFLHHYNVESTESASTVGAVLDLIYEEDPFVISYERFLCEELTVKETVDKAKVVCNLEGLYLLLTRVQEVASQVQNGEGDIGQEEGDNCDDCHCHQEDSVVTALSENPLTEDFVPPTA